MTGGGGTNVAVACRGPVDVPDRTDDGFNHPGYAIRRRSVVSRRELVVDPADQITVRNVTDEQEQAVGELVEPTVPEMMGWQRALVDVVRLGAGPASLVVPAAMKVPVAGQFRTTRAAAKFGAEFPPVARPWRSM